MEDHDIQIKENEEDEKEPIGINETDELAATELDKYAYHNIEEAMRIHYYTLDLIIIIN